MTFAKYTSQSSGSDNTRVAKWGLNTNQNLDLNLFSSSYKDSQNQNVIVDASDDASVVAPGTTKTAEVQLATFTNQPPEVMYHFEPSLKITNLGDSGQDLITKLNQNNGFTWSLKVNDGSTTSYDTTDDIINAVAALGQKDISPNTYPTSFGTTNTPKITIGWNWNFNNGGDQSDTQLGNLIANDNLKSMKVELGIDAYQCQGCGSSKQDPNFTPSDTMPASGTTKNMSTGGSFNTSATVESGAGAGTASSTNTSVATASATSSNDTKTISYTINAVSAGDATITLGAAENDTYKAASRTFNVSVTQPTPTGYTVTVDKDSNVELSGYDNPIANVYSVSAYTDSNGNNVLEAFDSNSSSLKKINASVSAKGYEFDGYYYTNGGTETLVPENAMTLENDLTITAKSKEAAKTEVTIPTAKEDLVYDGTDQSGVNYDDSYTYYTLYSGSVNATDASNYSAEFQLKDTDTSVWSDNTTENKTVNWSIAKAENPMTFTINPSSNSSTFSESSVSINFPGTVSGCTENLGYSVDDVATTNGLFGEGGLFGTGILADKTEVNASQYFSVADGKLICAASTPVGTYNLKLSVTSGGGNYKEKTLPESTAKNFTWTVNEAVNYESVQCKIGEKTVNFLPAIGDGDQQWNNVTFYKKNGSEYEKITGINSMSNFWTKIGEVGVANVYVEASGVTFYGIYDEWSWNDTFTATEEGGAAGGLNENFVDLFPEGKGISTVYFNHETSTNWDTSDPDKKPTLNGVLYKNFVETYGSDYLTESCWIPWSKLSENKTYAYRFDEFDTWSSVPKSQQCAVVMARDF